MLETKNYLLQKTKLPSNHLQYSGNIISAIQSGFSDPEILGDFKENLF